MIKRDMNRAFNSSYVTFDWEIWNSYVLITSLFMYWEFQIVVCYKWLKNTSPYQQDYRYYNTHKGTLQIKYSVIGNTIQSLKTVHIDVNLLGQVLSSTEHEQFLFPENEIVVDQVPYSAIQYNAHLMV